MSVSPHLVLSLCQTVLKLSQNIFKSSGGGTLRSFTLVKVPQCKNTPLQVTVLHSKDLLRIIIRTYFKYKKCLIQKKCPL